MTSEDIFLGYFDDTKDKSLEDKVREAAQRYEDRFGRKLSLALISEEADGVPIHIEGLKVQVASYVRPNCIWVGRKGNMGAVIEGAA